MLCSGRTTQRAVPGFGTFSRRRLLGWSLGLSGMFAACRQAGPQSQVQVGPPVEVTFMRPADQFLARAYEAQAERFNQKQSRIRARFDPSAGNDYGGWLAKLTSMLATDTAPDCFLVQQFDLPALAASGVLLDLTPLLARDAREVNPSDFFPSHLEGGRWRDRQVALTPDGCAILEYYNLTLFQEAGLQPPQPTWTWHEYLEMARRLTKRDATGQIVQAGIGTLPTGNQLLPWLWSNGADLFSPDFREVRIGDRAAVEALQFAVDLVQTHGVTTGSPGVALGQDPIREGKVAMWRANRGFFGSIQQVTAFKFNVVPLPRAPRTGMSTTVTTPGHIAIAASNKRPDAAWEWLKFLTSTEALIIRSEIAGGCPSRKSATEHPSYRDYTIPALASTDANKTFAEVLQDPRTARFVPKYIAINDAINIASRHITAATRGEVSVMAAIDAARQELEALLRQKPQP
jgi:multiple sugar transport system substrate-binding protein